MYKRFMKLSFLLKKKSFFLLGPRSTGKTTLYRQIFPRAKVYDLLHLNTYKRLNMRPQILEEENRNNIRRLIIIDEIQKSPFLLDMAQYLIDRGHRFLLTGSSARKLKRGSVNLLAGRVWSAFLFPLVSSEIPKFNLIQYLNRGGLPHIYGSPDHSEELSAYVHFYLKEEIQNEAFTRNIGAFSETLELIAQSNGQELNYDSFSKDLQISPNTLKNYISILDDTLLGFHLKGYTKTKKRKAIARSKYYLFDIGVTNTLCRRGDIQERSELFGKAFEHFIILEVRAFLSYSRKSLDMFYWRSTSHKEVDLIIGNKAAIEIKATQVVQEKHLKGLKALKEEGLIQKYFVVSLDSEPRMTQDRIHILPWNIFLKKLWQSQLL